MSHTKITDKRKNKSVLLNTLGIGDKFTRVDSDIVFGVYQLSVQYEALIGCMRLVSMVATNMEPDSEVQIVDIELTLTNGENDE